QMELLQLKPISETDKAKIALEKLGVKFGPDYDECSESEKSLKAGEPHQPVEEIHQPREELKLTETNLTCVATMIKDGVITLDECSEAVLQQLRERKLF